MPESRQDEREKIALKLFTAMVAASPDVDPTSKTAHDLAETAFKFAEVWFRRRDRERERVRSGENA